MHREHLAPARLRFRETSERGEIASQEQPDIDPARGKLECMAAGDVRFERVPAPVCKNRAGGVGGWVFGGSGNSLRKPVGGFVQPVEGGQSQAEVDHGVGPFRVKRLGDDQRVGGGARVVRPHLGHAEVEPGIRQLRIQDGRLAQGGHCSRIVAKVDQGAPQLKMSLGEARIQRNGASGQIRCRGGRAGDALHPGEIGERFRKCRLDLQRSGKQHDRSIEVAAFLQQDAQQVQCIRLVWVVLQNGTVIGLGQIGVAGLVVGEGAGQDLFRVQIVSQMLLPPMWGPRCESSRAEILSLRPSGADG